MEAWYRMTDVAQKSTKEIINNYNTKNTKGNKVEFVYVARPRAARPTRSC